MKSFKPDLVDRLLGFTEWALYVLLIISLILGGTLFLWLTAHFIMWENPLYLPHNIDMFFRLSLFFGLFFGTMFWIGEDRIWP